MTPVEIEVMLKACYLPGELILVDQFGHPTPQAYRDAIVKLINYGMIAKNSVEECGHITDKGCVYVDALRAIPLPIEKVQWVMPGPDDPFDWHDMLQEGQDAAEAILAQEKGTVR
jgi:hypothetical protein